MKTMIRPWSFVLVLFAVTTTLAQMPDKTKRTTPVPTLKVAGTAVTSSYQLLNINNLTSWMRVDGHSNHSPSNDDGLIYPRGTANAVYQDGIVWGGKAFTNPGKTTAAPNQVVRVGGGTYTIGTKGGRIIGTGAAAVPADPTAADVRVYRIRSDYKKMTSDELKKDASEFYEIP